MATAELPTSLPQRKPRQSPAAASWRPCLFDVAYARELLMPMLLGMLVLVIVMSGNFVYGAINSIVNQGLGIAPMLRLFFLSLPGFAVQGVAVGLILAVCLVINRAVRDNEIIALRAGGASVSRILMPFWMIALLATGLEYVLLERVTPVTNQMVYDSLARMMKTSATQLIEGDKYFRVGQYYFYVGSAEKGVLKNVMIYERNSGTFSGLQAMTFPNVILAREAHEDPKKPNTWVLLNVTTHSFGDDGHFKIGHTDEMKINVGQELSTYFADQKDPFAMSGAELNKQIDALENAAFDAGKVREMRVALYRKYSLPFACFVMALCAAPLSLRFARHGSFAGLVCAFVLAFLWQGFDAWFSALGKGGHIEPIVAAWSTNALFLCGGALLLWRER